MEWWRFLFWNALGGIVWATLVGVVAYKFGRLLRSDQQIRSYGGIAAVAILVIAYFVFRFWKKQC
jgi:membrane protein DedA with SNARE-associated domain